MAEGGDRTDVAAKYIYILSYGNGPYGVMGLLSKMSGEWMGVTTTRAPAVLIKYFLYSMDDHFRLAEQFFVFWG